MYEYSVSTRFLHGVQCARLPLLLASRRLLVSLQAGHETRVTREARMERKGWKERQGWRGEERRVRMEKRGEAWERGKDRVGYIGGEGDKVERK